MTGQGVGSPAGAVAELQGYAASVHNSKHSDPLKFRAHISEGVERLELIRAEFHSLNGLASGIINPMRIAQKFEHLLDSYRHPDGSRWTGQQLNEATDGLVARSYFVNLRKGRIRSPGYEKMAAIAMAMGFPPAAWFEESTGNES
jgi:hypothetical protein